MERLILLLLSPAIFAERHKTNDPNDEPFLPIHPTYPYNPKLMKRGTERELISHLTPELYAPRADGAKDTVDSTSYVNNDNYQRETYYNPNYDPYPQSNSPPSSTYPSYYSDDGYANLPYVAYNPYPAPYAASPPSYPASTYPDYYYQPPYYYPHYFNHALFPPLAAPPPSGVDYHETSSQDSETEAEGDRQDKDKKSNKPKEDETNRETSTSQFVDGGNYISGNSRDLDGQSSTYKVASPYNQLERDVQAKSLPIPLPKTTYRVISVAGQPVGPDYPLPATYVKAQQMERLMSQTLAKLLTRNAQQQAGQSYESKTGDTVNSANDGSYAQNQNAYNSNTPSYVALPGVGAKTGVVYVIDTDSVVKVNGERPVSQDSPSHATSNKNARYSNVLYVRKPASQTAPDHSQTTYVLPEDRNKHRDQAIDSQSADQVDGYESYDPAAQGYDGALSQSKNKQEQDYGSYQSQSGSYRNKDFTTSPQTPRSYSYQYSAYESDQATSQQPQQDKVTSDDGNFGAKQYNKR